MRSSHEEFLLGLITDVYLASRTEQIYKFAASVNFSATVFSASNLTVEVVNAASASYAMTSNGIRDIRSAPNHLRMNEVSVLVQIYLLTELHE